LRQTGIQIYSQGGAAHLWRVESVFRDRPWQHKTATAAPQAWDEQALGDANYQVDCYLIGPETSSLPGILREYRSNEPVKPVCAVARTACRQPNRVTG